MNKIFLSILLLGFGTVLLAQYDDAPEQQPSEFRTIFGGKSIGGYGAFGFGYSPIDGRDGITFDARGGIVLGHSLALGVGGVGFINEYHEVPSLNQNINLTGGYGGFFAELFLLPRWPVHLSFPVLGGIGGVAATSWEDIDGAVQTYVENTGVFLIVEPAVELEFNLTSHIRMAAFYSHRFTSDIDLGGFEYAAENALYNYSAGLRFKFGKF